MPTKGALTAFIGLSKVDPLTVEWLIIKELFNWKGSRIHHSLLPLRYAIFSCLMTTRQKRTIPLLGQGKAITLSNFHSCEVELKRHKLQDTPVMFYVSFRHNCRIDLINAICAGRLYQLYNYFIYIYVYCFHSSGLRWDTFQFTIHQFYAIVKPTIILI